MTILNAWGKPIRRSTTTGAATIDFTDLDDYRELLLEIRGLQHNSGTPDFYVQMSADNCATVDSTNYIHHGATGTAAFIFATSVATTTSVGALIQLFHFNLAFETTAKINGGRHGSTTGARGAGGYNSAATAWNALRVTNSTATNFTANGGIRLYGKQ